MILTITRVVVMTCALFGAVATPLRADDADTAATICWSADYASTMAAAESEGGLMSVYFHQDGNAACRRFDEMISASPEARGRLARSHCVRLALDAEIRSGGKTLRLLDHPAFAELHGGPGLVFFDFAPEKATVRGLVLRTLPFREDGTITAEELAFLGGATVPEASPAETLEWRGDYGEAIAMAEEQRRMLLIYFARRDGQGGCAEFEAETLSEPGLRERMTSYVCLRLDHDAKVNLGDREVVLLKDTSFSEMVGLPGIAIIDFSDPGASYYGQVVSEFPFLHGKAYDRRQMEVILTLPPAKLTQRTLIYAVRTHPDAPQSTSGRLDNYLLSEAESHSVLQARIRLQGHHSWESRFQRINRRLPGGLLAAEVCAESWPGENLLEAAIDCVRCWRSSAGHWRSVRSSHPVFAYDIRRGANGIWYATGIFGKRGG